LAKKIDWTSLEQEFEPLYGTIGRPSIPIRTSVGLLLLQHMYTPGDETVVERYLENPYWQHFCRESIHEPEVLCITKGKEYKTYK